MGCGKSTTGKQLAKALHYEFVDLDKAIEISEGRSIKEIFAKDGEHYFRAVEKRILEIIIQSEDNIVLSLGGGTPCFKDSMRIINQRTESFYLNYPAKLLKDRLKNSKTDRPLIADLNENELLEFIEGLLGKRQRYYMQAKHSIENFNNPKKEILAILGL